MSKDIFYDKDIFAANLLRLMKENREKQVDIARLLGVSKSTVSAYCSGNQMPRMDKIEQLARHYGVPRSALIEEASLVKDGFSSFFQTDSKSGEALLPRKGETTAQASPAAAGGFAEEKPSPILPVYNALNDEGQTELLRYGRYLTARPEYRAARPRGEILTIKHYIVPAAAGYASPIEGEDYELIPRPEDAPARADFCISISGDSMEPYIRDGELVYVQRDAPLREFDPGVFFVDGDVFCKQWCVDYAGTLHLLSANPRRQDANIVIPRDSGRSCVCFGKVLLNRSLPRPVYD